MEANQRTVTLPLIIWLVYGLLMLVEKGIFLTPYPLNPIVFSVITCYFLIRNPNRKLYWLLLIPVGLTLLHSPVFLEFILSTEKQQWFQESMLFDLTILLHALAMGAFAFLCSIFQPNPKQKYFGVISTIALIIGILFAQPLVLFVAYGIQTLINRKSRLFEPFHHLWLLLFGLTFLELITLFINHSYPF